MAVSTVSLCSTLFSSNHREHILEGKCRVHLDKTTLTRDNWEKWCSKSVRVIYIIYITVLGRTDFEHPIFSIISSQNCFIEMDLLLKMFFCWDTKKFLFSKLVNNLLMRYRLSKYINSPKRIYFKVLSVYIDV